MELTRFNHLWHKMYKKYLVVAEIWDQLCVSNSDMMFSLDINNINVDIHLLMIEINIPIPSPKHII